MLKIWEEILPKKQLWDHLDTFRDNLTTWFNGQSKMPDLVHSHLPDQEDVGVHLANLLGVPLVHTGHSLGPQKKGSARNYFLLNKFVKHITLRDELMLKKKYLQMLIWLLQAQIMK